MSRLGDGSGLTVRGQSFVTSGVVLLGSGLVLGLPDLVRLGLLLLLLCGVALAVARRAPEDLEVTRSVEPTGTENGRLVVGEHARVTIHVHNRGTRRTPTAVTTEMLPRSVGDRPRLLLPPLHPGERRDIGYELVPRRRGELALGPLTLQLRDSFGLSTRDVATGGAHTVLVQPRPIPLGGGTASAVGAGGDAGAAHGVATSGSEDVSVREYRYGDELRRINWRATARTGQLMVRQEERPTRRGAVVLLDSRASSHSGHEDDSTFEWAVTCAASVVAHLRDLGLEVTLVSDATVDHVRSGPLASLDDPFDSLARAVLGSDDDFTRCIHAVDEIATSGAVVVAILGADAQDGDSLATTRHPSSRGIAFVVAGDIDDDAALCTASTLAWRGWRATVATPRTSVPEAWALVASRDRVGA